MKTTLKTFLPLAYPKVSFFSSQICSFQEILPSTTPLELSYDPITPLHKNIHKLPIAYESVILGSLKSGNYLLIIH